MFGSLNQLKCCAGYLRSTATSLRERSPSPNNPTFAAPRLHVLIVEFRDEVFARLKTLFEEHGYKVSRAAIVTDQTPLVAADLLLVSEDMPDDSGWLITCKLRLAQVWQPIWLYAVRAPRVLADWKEWCGVNDVIVHGGELSRLAAQIRQRLQERMGHSKTDRPLPDRAI